MFLLMLDKTKSDFENEIFISSSIYSSSSIRYTAAGANIVFRFFLYTLHLHRTSYILRYAVYDVYSIALLMIYYSLWRTMHDKINEYAIMVMEL